MLTDDLEDRSDRRSGGSCARVHRVPLLRGPGPQRRPSRPRGQEAVGWQSPRESARAHRQAVGSVVGILGANHRL